MHFHNVISTAMLCRCAGDAPSDGYFMKSLVVFQHRTAANTPFPRSSRKSILPKWRSLFFSVAVFFRDAVHPACAIIDGPKNNFYQFNMKSNEDSIQDSTRIDLQSFSRLCVFDIIFLLEGSAANVRKYAWRDVNFAYLAVRTFVAACFFDPASRK